MSQEKEKAKSSNQAKQEYRAPGGSWMKDVGSKLSEAIAIGVRSSGKDETRRYRVEFYRAQVTRAKLEVGYYEQMLWLEEQNASETMLGRSIAGVKELADTVTELQESMRGLQAGDEASSVWTAGQETPVGSVKDGESGDDEADWRRSPVKG